MNFLPMTVQLCFKPTPASWRSADGGRIGAHRPPITLLMLILMTLPVISSAEEALPQTATISPGQARQSFQWLAGQLMRHVPPTLTGEDDWGDAKEVWAGVKVRRDGWKLKTNRRKKELRHGRWIRYQIDLPDLARTAQTAGPDETGRALNDLIDIRSVTPNLHAWRIDAAGRIPAHFSLRVERWNLGFQIYSLEIRGKMTLSLQTKLQLSMQPDWSEVPPAMQLVADVEQATLAIEHFEVERISKIGGDVAEEIGDLAEHTIGRVWMRKENERLASRLNRAIERNRDDFRWSMADWITRLQLDTDR